VATELGFTDLRRRVLLGAGLCGTAWLALGCGDRARDPTPDCAETEDNIEGPFYKDGAPERTSLLLPGSQGAVLTVDGRVLACDGTPLPAALLDVWQADAAGSYDHQGYTLRGRLRSDDLGRYRLETIVPGRYLNAGQYRPAHIHVKVSAPMRRPLTTQLYFEGDPFNERDPFIARSLVMRVRDQADGRQAADFDFVLGTA
jgi:protocatechuate 3,4-dioxygenase beta subunit